MRPPAVRAEAITMTWRSESLFLCLPRTAAFLTASSLLGKLFLLLLMANSTDLRFQEKDSGRDVPVSPSIAGNLEVGPAGPDDGIPGRGMRESRGLSSRRLPGRSLAERRHSASGRTGLTSEISDEEGKVTEVERRTWTCGRGLP